MKYEVEITRMVTTTVTVDTPAAQDAAELVDQRDFPLPPADQWQVVKRSYEYTVLDSEGNTLIDSDGNEADDAADRPRPGSIPGGQTRHAR